MSQAPGSALEERLRAVLARWVALVCRRHGLVLLLAGLLTAASGYAIVRFMAVEADTDALFDDELGFRVQMDALNAAFPALEDEVLVVVDAPTPGRSRAVAHALAEALRETPEVFPSVFTPGVGRFWDRSALLYPSVAELEDLLDELATVQPFLAELSRDPTLHGFFTLLERATREADGSVGFDLAETFGEIEASVRAVARDTTPVYFDQLALGGAGSAATRSFVIVKPRSDRDDFVPAATAMSRIQALIDRHQDDEVLIRLTGDIALENEELELIQRQASLAGIASLVMVTGLLLFALRSPKMVLATLLTLIAGLIWTAGFAALAIGRLNVVSVAFAVLFIGLGVDFGIHFCLRYRELRGEGQGHQGALEGTARSVGTSLVLCAATTSIGFYAFVPTSYAGVAELGMISGTGMFLSVFASLTLLPALLSLGGSPRLAPLGSGFAPRFLARHPARVCGVAAVLGVVGCFYALQWQFDPNPLRVRDPNAPSVVVFNELVEEGDINPWSAEVIVPDLAAAQALAVRIERRPTVDRVYTLASYVPDDQEQKLAMLADAELMLNLGSAVAPPATSDAEEAALAIVGFRSALATLSDTTLELDLAGAARGLGAELDVLLEGLRGPERAALNGRLEISLVANTLDAIAQLRMALRAEPVSLGSLPAELRARQVSADGRARVEVFPRGSLNDNRFLEDFIADVRAEAPNVTGSSAYMVESKQVVVDALRDAFTGALVLIAAILLLLWRSVRDASLVLLPLLLAAIATAAAAERSGLMLNYADVLVLPLLLGIGVDSGIHLVHRYRTGGGEHLLETSTSRAVVFSAMTTISSFGSLAFASHGGLRTLGQLLTLGVIMTVAANLVVLPALIALSERRRARRRDSSSSEPEAA